LNPRQLNCTQKQCLLCERKRLKSPFTVRWLNGLISQT
jgi:hypothetical protein